MLDRLILHVGTHKTGTSAIQYWADNNRSELLSHNYLYPKTGQWHDHAHHKLAYHIWGNKNALHDKRSFESLVSDLEREIDNSKCKTAIISSELLEKVVYEKAPTENLKYLCGKLCKKLDVVLFLRRQDLLVESIFKQWVKDSSVRFRKMPATFIGQYAKFMDYDQLVQSWGKLEFVSSVSVVTNALARDPIADFVKSIDPSGLQFLDTESIRTVNPSMDGRALKLRFFLNELCEDSVIDRRLKRILMLPQFTDGRLSLFQSDEIRSRYLSRFYESNSKLCEKYNLEPFSNHRVESSGVFKRMNGHEFYECLRGIAEIDEKICGRILNLSCCSNNSKSSSSSKLNKIDQIKYLTKALSEEEIGNKDLITKNRKETRQTLNQKSRRLLRSLEKRGVILTSMGQPNAE